MLDVDAAADEAPVKTGVMLAGLWYDAWRSPDPASFASDSVGPVRRSEW
jgi:hypothetical protein